MQENHSFDNYFGVLPYASGAPYHGGGGKCTSNDHTCVDGLSCTRGAGNYTCTNSNLDDDASTVVAFHDARYCTGPDLQHNQAPSMNTSVPTAPPPTASEPGCS